MSPRSSRCPHGRRRAPPGQDFSSLAAETVFFLDEIDRRHLAAPYARVHLDKLRQELDQTRQEIAQASPPQARNLKIHASRLGDALWVQLDTLEGKLEDRAARQRAHDEAVRVRDALESLKA